MQPKAEPADWTTLEVPAEEPDSRRARGPRARGAPQLGGRARYRGPGATDGDGCQIDVDVDGAEERSATARQPRRWSPAARPGGRPSGMSVGDPGDHPGALPEGETRTARVTVKELKEPVLPPLDDELAKAASSSTPRRAACGHRRAPAAAGRRGARGSAFRGAAVDALVEESGVEVSDALVEAGGQPIQAFVNGLERRGISLETYLAVSGETPEQIQQRMVEDARSLARADPRGCGRTARNRGLGRRAARLHPRAGRIRRRGGSGRTGGRAVAQRPARDAAHGPQAACRARPCRERGQADLARACERTRKALDARAGEARRRCETVDPGEKEPA